MIKSLKLSCQRCYHASILLLFLHHINELFAPTRSFLDNWIYITVNLGIESSLERQVDV